MLPIRLKLKKSSGFLSTSDLGERVKTSTKERALKANLQIELRSILRKIKRIFGADPHQQRNAVRLNSQQLDLDVTRFSPEVEHRAVPVHCRAGVDDFDAVNVHDAPGLVDVGTAHEVK